MLRAPGVLKNFTTTFVIGVFNLLGDILLLNKTFICKKKIIPVGKKTIFLQFHIGIKEYPIEVFKFRLDFNKTLKGF